VFHTSAGHVTLNDNSYKTDRMVATSNGRGPHEARSGNRVVKENRGSHHRGNEDLLPGIKVNADAMAKISQLAQEGFVEITERD